MKTKKAIEKKLIQIKTNKAAAKGRYSDAAYISNCKAEKLLEWILEGE